MTSQKSNIKFPMKVQFIHFPRITHSKGFEPLSSVLETAVLPLN